MRNRKGSSKPKFKGEDFDENKNITEAKTAYVLYERLNQLSLFYLAVSLLCTGFVVMNIFGKGQSCKRETRIFQNSNGTTEDESTMLKQIEEADELLFQGQWKNALKMFTNLVAFYPQNPRALWGYARVLEKLGSQKDSDYFIKDAKSALYDVITLPEIPRDIFNKALIKLTQLYIETEPTSSLDRLWILLSTQYGSSSEPRHLFIEQLIRHKNTAIRGQIAVNKLFEMVAENPKDCVSIATVGKIYHSREKDLHKAAEYLQRAVDLDCDQTRLRRFFTFSGLSDIYTRLGQKDKAAEVNKLGAERGIFLSADQRSLSNADTAITARPWWTYEQTTYQKSLQFLESHWEEIRDEGLAILDEGSKSFKNDSENLLDEGIWQKMLLYRNGHKYNKNCAKAPKSCKLLKQVPDATSCTRGQIKFSVLTPGTHLWAHSGPTNCRIRAHLGLRIPEGPVLRIVNETRKWVEGKFIIFDDLFEHEVWHEGTGDSRLVLIVDFWHPDITMEQTHRIWRYN